MSDTKKQKTMQTTNEQEQQEFDALTKYLVECPVVSKNCRAMQAALTGLEQEQKRMERDAKLQRKFTNKQDETTTTSSAATTQLLQEDNPDDVVHVSNDTPALATHQRALRSIAHSNHATVDDDAELMEWQDVAETSKVDEQAVEGSLLGKQLAAAAIANMSQANIKITSPVAAIALALHAALTSDILQFACTGIPDTAAAGVSNSFAAPVRELPKSQFVPPNWDKHANSSCATTTPQVVNLRYRKRDLGAVILCVQQVVSGNDKLMVEVHLTPTTTQEPPIATCTFDLANHVNLESLSAAILKEKRVLPALHYKALPLLLTNFVRTFDLGGSVGGEAETSAAAMPYVDTTIVSSKTSTTAPLRVEPAVVDSSSRPDNNPHVFPSNYEKPTIQLFQPQRPGGDFAGDLGIPGVGGGISGGGNLMGPNHPAFGGDGLGGDSGFGMRPRFDPYGPPGGPTDPNFGGNIPGQGQQQQEPPGRLKPKKPPGGSGDPNPDHARPPSNLNNNMFM